MLQRLIPAAVLILTFMAGCSTAVGNRSIRFGIDMAKAGLWKEAAFRWQMQVEQTGPSAALYNNLAVAAESQGNFDEADRLYREALKLAPNHPVILDNHKQFIQLREGKALEEEKPEKKKRRGPDSPQPPVEPQGETE